MLDRKDLEAIAKLIDARAEQTESLLLDEIGRTQTYLEKQITEVKKNMEELSQYYRITKLESDNTTLLLKMIDQLNRRVEELEKRTA
ncbi:hypothetical protein GCM10008922_25200 [Faecalicatena contorta]|uniref:Uncharacterized protein n=2 Tax=Lachnospiraceae TaxID=186803 RepID=A0A174JHP7_9FIRM|nr:MULTISPECIES: hypothetical protein [Clostridia]MEE0200795.1 hypothetical protein [Muricomes sp.]RGC24879.1 hypothetical protein DWX41_20945 [Hungatella hathewayi]CUO99232.1 Uncharacterised protein [[Eubacterium] contortum] [Faecalicatena contorta]DAZ71631.1 MAG TPA: hypothetical protein [Caudoviricetes sp.]